MRIPNKEVMYQLLHNGELGNIVQSWSTIEEIEQSEYRGLISIRSKIASCPIKLYHVPYVDLRRTIISIPAGIRSSLTFCESPPDHKRTIQGELTRLVGGLYLHYSYAPLPMRFALQDHPLHAYGLRAKMILEYWLEPSDYEWLYELLDRYPDAVVEFTGFTVPVGIIPHSKMIVWEVRNY